MHFASLRFMYLSFEYSVLRSNAECSSTCFWIISCARHETASQHAVHRSLSRRRTLPVLPSFLSAAMSTNVSFCAPVALMFSLFAAVSSAQLVGDQRPPPPPRCSSATHQFRSAWPA